MFCVCVCVCVSMSLSLTRSIPGARGLGVTGCERGRFRTPFVSAGRLLALLAPSHGGWPLPPGPESKPSMEDTCHMRRRIHVIPPAPESKPSIICICVISNYTYMHIYIYVYTYVYTYIYIYNIM